MDYPGKVITKTQVTPTQTSASGNWTLDDQAAAIKNNNWPVALVPNPISKSLRFNSADNAFLNRTPASAGNRKTWTWSGWVKRSKLGAQQGLIGCPVGTSDSTFMNLQFNPSDQLGLGLYTQYILLTTQVFRDTSAWYHIVVAFNTTNATADNRCRMYVNGVEITTFTSRNNPTLNADYGINQASQHDIGRSEYTNSTCLGGYLTEINFIDGQQLTPSDFGLTNPQTGQWIPKKYTGTYGTNGFYLNFKDATSTTTLGYDYSGNANNWTTNNFSVTAGSGNDSLTDVPTPWVAYNTTGDVGGVFRGNYAVLNPLKILTNAPTNGNLSLGTTTYSYGQSTFTNPTGKVYVEATVTGGSATNSNVFVRPINAVLSVITDVNANNTVYYRGDGGLYLNGSSVLTYTTYAASDVIGVALDNSVSPPTVRFYKNNVAQGSSAYTLPAVTTTGEFCIGGIGNGSGFEFNFGQRAFAYTPPAGFRSLCTTNLPATTIGFGLTNQGDDYFNAVLYNGTNANGNSVTGVGFQPDFVWTKSRNAAYGHNLFDAVRGVYKNLGSNGTYAEETNTDKLVSFNSDGFTVNADQIGSGGCNYGTGTYVAWNWKAGGTGVTNTAGSITSTVSANTTAGFSIVTYTGTGSNATVGHGLGVAPSMIITKPRNSADNWISWHTALGATGYIYLNLTNASATGAAVWNSTLPTSTVFSIGTSSNINSSGQTQVAYCFAAVAGYSAFGSYTGNGNADGPFVYLGFRPRYVMVKRTDSTAGWAIFDAARSTFNVVNDWLYANVSDSEYVDTGTPFDFTSNGFKVRVDGTYVAINANTGTYIYAAFAEFPFQFANAR